MGRKHSQIQGKRFLCPVQGCDTLLKNKDEVKSRHLPRHPGAARFWDAKTINALTADEEAAWRRGDHTLEFPQIELTVETAPPAPTMDNTTAGRGQREKKPSEKIKEAIGKKIDTIGDNSDRKNPPIYFADHVKASAEVKEIEKIYNHTKVTATGESYDFYQLGGQ